MAMNALTGQVVMKIMTDWYQETIVRGAIRSGNDMLLFQWGALRCQSSNAIVDLRQRRSGRVTWEEQECHYVNFTRQTFRGDDETLEFDDEAIQMGITLGYDAAVGEVKGSNLWIDSRDSLPSRLGVFCATPFVREFLGLQVRRFVATVEHCG